MMTKLPSTDDRLRPDMRLMEHGYYLAVSHALSMIFEILRVSILNLNT